MLRPQKLAKGPLRVREGSAGFGFGERLVICIGNVLTTETVQRPLYLRPKKTLPPAPIAEQVNVIEDICMIQILGFVGPFSDALLFQRTEARL
ncbi:TPA: hypothetical protein MHS89_00085 [Klebsiella pneumoniae]|nr:hypothetical protein AL516_06755 [Klebsiella pneumoniae]EIW8540844.1 hypothetical protein [Klebsiella pneumoniae]EIW8778682.1 hypothetical protein [Klebsiella pneumoniae]EIW9275663.1 hypothetical protein [Klebsiella pneumoniae]KAA1510212.1 hypothetical protein F1D54_00255 [Klebsiella pneumoniae]